MSSYFGQSFQKKFLDNSDKVPEYDPMKPLPVPIHPKGVCQCGCGNPTRLASDTHKERGQHKGEPSRFLPGHNARGHFGSDNNNWKGGRFISKEGYVLVRVPGHSRTGPNDYVFEHILVAEKILGKPLPPGAVIHHIDENRANNNPPNLIICEGRAYHALLHKRMAALKACGHAGWIWCRFCRTYDTPVNMYMIPGRSVGYHKKCVKEYRIRKGIYPCQRHSR